MIDSYLGWITTIALFTCALITIPANMVILYCLRKAGQNMDRMKMARTSISKVDEVKITCVLLGVSFIFFFFTIPNRYKQITAKDLGIKSSGLKQKIKYQQIDRKLMI